MTSGIAYNRFTPLVEFAHAPKGQSPSIYMVGAIYTARTSDLQKLAAQWVREGKVRIIPPAEFSTIRAVARGTMETS